MTTLYHRALHAATLCEQGDDYDEARAVRELVASHQALLAELSAAHQIIRIALAIMTPEQKRQWGERNGAAGVDGDGITRANERAAVIANAEAFA